ncbi:MAG: hypothetical protein CSH36_07135 [Thalassolituus sp.]|nr:MAG: hypothetical protein CSH36_07135 [Thalassolituus sp.]
MSARILLGGILPVVIALQGCSRTEDSDPVSLVSDDVEYFDLSAYENAEADTDRNSISGTWVGSWRYRSDYEDPGESALSGSPEFFARLDIMIIRSTADGYEISNCNVSDKSGKFVTATLNEGYLTSGRGQFNISADNRLYPPEVTLEGISNIYDVRFATTAEGEFLKVSDSTAPIGNYTADWSGDDNNFSGDIYCAQLDNLQGGTGHRFSFGSDDGTHFTMTQRPLISDFDVQINDALNELKYERNAGAGEYQLGLYDIDTSGFTFDFSTSADSVTTRTSVGQGTVTIPLP